ncbi:hypothetical protein [Pseudomonas sp. EA_65y_Pfl1_P120]|uniref:hypothetical protein n=1 Tax=Pseudomonas sp. EA_65y_Pfl1_P120 TaxID=3088693 RepID=UPI0030DAACF3
MYKKRLSWALSTVLLTGCTALQGNPKPEVSLADDKSQIVGLWAMQALNEGQTTVADFRADGQLVLHAFDCVTSSQKPPDVMGYSVVEDGQVINMILPSKTLELKVLTFSPEFMQFTSRTGGMTIRYDFEKVDKVDSLCERYPDLKAEQARIAPYKASDFVAAPTIPKHPSIDRYVGTWGSDNVMMVTIARDASGGFYLSTPSDKNWHYLYNNVHWVGDVLHFQRYTYSDSEASFRSPKHRLQTPTSLEPMPDGSLREDFILNGDPYMSTLTRMK